MLAIERRREIPEWRACCLTTLVRRAAGQLPLRREVATHHPPIHAEHAVPLLPVDLVRVRDADATGRAEVSLQPDDVVQRRFITARRCICKVHRGQDADVEAVVLPRHFRGRNGLCDATRVNQLTRRRELLLTLQEERATFWEEHGGARVVRELGRVGLDLREVGVRRARQCQIARDPPTRATADFWTGTRVREFRRPCVWQSDRRRRDRGDDVHRDAATQITQPREMTGLCKKARVGAQGWRPAFFMSGRLHGADDVQLPLLFVTGAITQALERDRDLDFVAELGQATFRLPDVIGREICRLTCLRGTTIEPAARLRACLRQYTVALDAEWIHGEDERLTTIVVRAQKELHIIIRRDLVTIGERRPHSAGWGIRANADVKCRGRIKDQHLGAVLRRHAVGREELREAGQQRRA